MSKPTPGFNWTEWGNIPLLIYLNYETWKETMTLVLEAIDAVVGKSVFHHHRHSAWQRTEPQRVYGDTGITEMGQAMAA